MPAPTTFALAALAEIAGCYAVWVWVRQGASVLWLLPGLGSLAAFAWLLTQVDSAYAGRAYAAYGGVYVTAALVWLWLVKGAVPRPVGHDRRDRLPCRCRHHPACAAQHLN